MTQATNLRPHSLTTTHNTSQLLVQDSSTPRGGWCTTHPPVPRRGLERCSPWLRPPRWAHSCKLAATALITPSRCQWLPSHASDQCMSWSMTPGVRPEATLAYYAWHNGGSGHTLTPNSAAWHCPLGDPTTRWAARYRVVPATTPPDRDNGAPGWGRLCPTSGVLIISHVADRRGSA
jgi:hypothetical protein